MYGRGKWPYITAGGLIPQFIACVHIIHVRSADLELSKIGTNSHAP